MKRAISTLMFLILIIHSGIGVAFSDKFTIHSGVEFGMTLDEIKSQENNAGFNVTSGDLSYSVLGYKNNQSMIAATRMAFGTNSPATVHGSIAGFDNSYIYYFFNNDKLVSAIYHFGEKNKSDRYAIISSALEEKYGKPMIDNDQTIGIPTKGKNAINMIVSLYRIGNILECPINALRQWLVPVDDGYIVIYLFDFIYGTKKQIISKEVLLSYSFVTDYDYEAFKQSQKDAIIQALEVEERKKDELNNDL